MAKIISFGENVEGFKIPVLNEREIRAAAGILFVLMFISVMLAILKADFLLLKYSITIFTASFKFFRAFSSVGPQDATSSSGLYATYDASLERLSMIIFTVKGNIVFIKILYHNTF